MKITPYQGYFQIYHDGDAYGVKATPDVWLCMSLVILGTFAVTTWVLVKWATRPIPPPPPDPWQAWKPFFQISIDISKFVISSLILKAIVG